MSDRRMSEEDSRTLMNQAQAALWLIQAGWHSDAVANTVGLPSLNVLSVQMQPPPVDALARTLSKAIREGVGGRK